MTASMTTLSSRCFVMSTTERRHSVSPEEIQPFGFGEVFRYKHPTWISTTNWFTCSVGGCLSKKKELYCAILRSTSFASKHVEKCFRNLSCDFLVCLDNSCGTKLCYRGTQAAMVHARQFELPKHVVRRILSFARWIF